MEDENIIEHFAGSNAFIQEGLDGGGGVLVHWWVRNFFFSKAFLASLCHIKREKGKKEGYDLPVFHYFAVIEMQYVLVFSASPDTAFVMAQS